MKWSSLGVRRAAGRSRHGIERPSPELTPPQAGAREALNPAEGGTGFSLSGNGEKVFLNALPC